MDDKRQRVEIPGEIAAEVLFLADRTCCVCRQRGRPVQLHHIDNDPSNSVADNLAVLCLDCHRDTQIRGGFDRKLDALQIKRYKADWIRRVEEKRGAAVQIDPVRGNGGQVLRYLQLREKSDEHSYDFEADYVLVGSADSDSEINLLINAFVTKHLQRFRADAIASTAEKNAMKHTALAAAAWDSLVISHNVSLYTLEVLSLEFQLASYGAGAAHPNTNTETLNFRLRPSVELSLHDIFDPKTNYLEVLSRYCVNDLHRQQPQRWHDPTQRAEQLENQQDVWILRGAGAVYRNFERFSIKKNGIVIHFDPYQVACYAEGKYEVFVPANALESVVQEEIAKLLAWR